MNDDQINLTFWRWFKTGCLWGFNLLKNTKNTHFAIMETVRMMPQIFFFAILSLRINLWPVIYKNINFFSVDTSYPFIDLSLLCAQETMTSEMKMIHTNQSNLFAAFESSVFMKEYKESLNVLGMVRAPATRIHSNKLCKRHLAGMKTFWRKIVSLWSHKNCTVLVIFNENIASDLQ